MRVLTGPRVLRVVWVPGTDRLLGTCHCSARHIAGDPISMWEWLLAHPDGHDLTTEPAAEPTGDPAGRDS